MAALPEEAIDTSDLPEAGPDQWQNAQVGQFYRPLKRQVTLRVDVPVLDWFKQHATDGKGYQTDINRALREYIAAREKAG